MYTQVWSGWISDSYSSLIPLWSGMGAVVPAHTSPTLHPPSPPTVTGLIYLVVVLWQWSDEGNRMLLKIHMKV